MANVNLGAAKNAKQDEFYTQWVDIEREMNAYLEYDSDAFRGKVILLPCDDPEWSDFTKFFALHFADFGIKKLISTSYAPESNFQGAFYQPTLFETESPIYDPDASRVKGRVFTLVPEDLSGDGVINIDDMHWEYLEGDGDFRSDEVTAFRDESDIVITNPPFSLWRKFVAWLIAGGKDFAIIGPQNAITYKEIFPLIKENRMWLGRGFSGGNAYFRVPESVQPDYAAGVFDEGTRTVHFRNVRWFSSLDHGRRHEPLQLMSMADNLKFNKKLIKKLDGGSEYISYDNFDAIEVPYVDAIPSDYGGMMGVPLTFLDKYDPDQFEIVGTNRYTTPHGMSQKFVDDYYASGQTGQISEGHPDLCYYDFHGRPVVAYDRILIRHRTMS